MIMENLNYENLVLAFADNDGNIFVKGAMKQEEIEQMKKLHGFDEKEILGFLFQALLEEWRAKLENNKNSGAGA